MSLYKPADEFVFRVSYRIHDGSGAGIKIFVGEVCMARITQGSRILLELGIEHCSYHETVAGAIQIALSKLKEKKGG